MTPFTPSSFPKVRETTSEAKHAIRDTLSIGGRIRRNIEPDLFGIR